MIELGDIRSAAARIEGVANRTPVLTSRRLDQELDARVFCKAENYQRTGSFKFRGAYNRISCLSGEDLDRGIVTISSGNHAQAVALAAKLMGVSALVLMPNDAPPSKREATSAYGADVVEFDRYSQSRDDIVAQAIAESGRTFVPPYDHPHIMAGQGTAALELIEDIGDLDVLVVPVSGGGLIAGCGVAAKALRPQIRLVGVEPEGADDTRRSIAEGKRVEIPVPGTIADGLRVTTPGALTFEINRSQIDDMAVVTDKEIVDAMRFLHDAMKTVVEPSGAAAFAALYTDKLEMRDRRVGVILSGGNVDAERFAALVR